MVNLSVGSKIRPFKQQPDLEIDDRLVAHPLSKDYNAARIVPMYALLSDVIDPDNLKRRNVRCTFSGSWLNPSNGEVQQLEGGGYYRCIDSYGYNEKVMNYEDINLADWCVVPPEPTAPPVQESSDQRNGLSLATIFSSEINPRY